MSRHLEQQVILTATIKTPLSSTARKAAAVAQAKGFPMVNNYVEPEATYRGNPGNAASFRHWSHGSEVTVAVKKAAYDSANFQGVGFYGKDNIINNASDQQRIFHAKKRLKIVGSDELKNEGNPPDITKPFVKIPVIACRKGRIEQSILRSYVELKALGSSDSKHHPAPPKE
jgi:hypothetical protein